MRTKEEILEKIQTLTLSDIDKALDDVADIFDDGRDEEKEKIDREKNDLIISTLKWVLEETDELVFN